MGYVSGAGFLVARVLFGLALLVPILRVLIPLARVRFSNPVCQGVYRYTNPVVSPLGRFLPTWRGLSTAALLLAWAFTTLAVWLILLLFFSVPDVGMVLLLGLGALLHYVLSLYLWMIILVALMSFFSPDYGNPYVELVCGLTRPVLALFDRIPIRLGTISLSPLWACLVIQLAQYTLDYVGLPGFLW